MSLIDKVRAAVSKVKDPGIRDVAEFDVLYSTGFLGPDFLNGTRVHVESEDRNFTYRACGIVDGSCNMVIGRTGCGKSTFLMQMAGNIIRPFIDMGAPTGLYIDDIEGSLPYSRKEFLLGIDTNRLKEFLDLRNKGITSDNIFLKIKAIHDEKLSNRKMYEYDTGLFDVHGERVFKLYPTVYVIDSIPMLMPDNLTSKDEMGGSMDASAIAKSNTALFKRIGQLCKASNIILFSINHITDDIQTGFAPKPAQISGLKQGERLPGGKMASYLANNLFRIDDSITLKADKDYGIDGSICNFTIIKSRTNVSKRSVPLIFNKTEGKFDEILSLYHLLKTEGKVQGAGRSLYFESLPDVTFTTKTFKETLSSSKKLQKAFAKECFETIEPYLSETKANQVNMSTSQNIIDLVSQF